MSSDSKKIDKFLINVVPTFEPAEDSALEFNTQFSLVQDEFVQKYRLRCMSNGSGGSNLLSASGAGSVGTISSPIAPNIPVNAADSMSSITSSIDEKQTSSKENLVSAPTSFKAPVSSPVPVPAAVPASVPTLQRELKDARSEIDRLKLLLKKGADWKNILSAQYGAPPVLVILVAIFAFMIGLLF